MRTVPDYYATLESRLGYRLLLGGTRHFGWYEPTQSRWQFSGAMRQMEDQVAARLNLPAGSHVLDAGCGVGDVARHLAANHQLTVTGVDLLEHNITEAKRRAQRTKLLGQVSFRQRDYSSPAPLSGEPFDGAYTTETLVHTPDPAQALRRLKDALKPGGRLVLLEYEHTPYSELPEQAARAIKRINSLSSMPAFDQFETGEIERQAALAGFENITVEDVTDRMLPMLSAFNTLAAAPYRLACAAGVEERLVNAMAAVEMWRHRGAWRYCILTAVKPV